MNEHIFTSKRAAQTACAEVLDFGYPAGVERAGTRKWRVGVHRRTQEGSIARMLLGTDGKLHDILK